MKNIKINKGLYFLVITFCVSLFLGLSACSTKQGPINDLSDLAEEVQANGSNYSAEEWNLVNEDLEVIESEIEQYKDEYTDEELKEIGRLKGILLAQYTKASVKSITSGVENAMKEAEGLVEGLFDGFSNEASE